MIKMYFTHNPPIDAIDWIIFYNFPNIVGKFEKSFLLQRANRTPVAYQVDAVVGCVIITLYTYPATNPFF